MSRLKLSGCVALSLCALSGGTSAIGAVRVIAYGGQRATGITNATFVSFGSPIIAADGRVAFSANFRREVSPNPLGDPGIWISDHSMSTLVAARGEQAIGMAEGVTYQGFLTDINGAGRVFSMDRAGGIVAKLGVAGPGITPLNSTGYWRFGNGSITLVRLGDVLSTAAGTGVVSELLYGSAGFPGASVLNLRATVGTSQVNGVWSVSDGAPTLLFAAGQALMGLPDGVVLAQSSYTQQVSNEAYLFDSRLGGNGITSDNDAAILELSSGTAQVVVSEGMSISPQLSLGEPTQVTVAARTRFAFGASVRGAGVDATNDFAIFAMRDGQLRTVVREGDAAPGGNASERIGDVVTTAAIVGRVANVAIDSSGIVAFRANIVGPNVTSANDTAIWAETAGGLQLIAREGAPAPGLPTGVRFGALRRPVMNSASQMIFLSGLVQPQGTENSSAALWFAESDGSLTCLLKRGDTLVVDAANPSDIRTVTSIVATTDAVETTAASALNEAGQTAVRVSFSNGTDAIVLIDPTQGCDTIDFNRNAVYPEDQDVVDFFNVLSGANCPYNPPCDIDFNNNGVVPEDQDVIDFFDVLAGGEC